jgi:uncharacterized repeat protein (TIGR01451 family)
MYNDSGSPTIQNNIFFRNSVCFGGGIFNGSGSPLIQNNTFTGNTANLGGGGLLVGGSPILRNNIIVDNWSGLQVYDSGTPTIDFNDVWNNHGGDYSGIIPGPHDISADPAWVDPANGDFHLSSGSPCINAGDPVNFPATDIDGDPRPLGSASDIGVDEYHGLRLAIGALQEEIPPGKLVTYHMILGNYTTISLTNVLLTDTLPAETAYTSYQAEGLICMHDGSTWGGQLSCSLDSLSLAPGESRTMTVTVLLSQTLPLHQYVTNHVLATANGGGRTFIAGDQARSWVTWCSVQLNGKPMGNDLQAAVDTSTQITDVIQVTDYCHVHDLRLNKTLTLQGGWSHDFNEWDPAVYTTTLDGQSLGRVIWVDGVVTPTIEGFIITGGYTNGSGGGTLISSGSPTIQNNTFTGNTAIWGGGGLYNLSGNPTIQNNTFSVNFGIGLYNGSGNPTIQNNTFSNNSDGGVVNDSGSPLVQNNMFIDNGDVYFGGGLYNGSGNPVIQNNTFSGNSAWGSGGGLYNDTGNPVIRSNIVVSNTAGAGGGIFSSSPITPTLDYNDVWNNTGGDYGNVSPGAHDISVDPLLVDPINGDFHLASNSPCIDAGDPVNYPPTDFEGDIRPQGLAPDIGADEYCSPP